MPAQARNRGHRLAAYRQCSADSGGSVDGENGQGWDSLTMGRVIKSDGEACGCWHAASQRVPRYRPGLVPRLASRSSVPFQERQAPAFELAFALRGRTALHFTARAVSPEQYPGSFAGRHVPLPLRGPYGRTAGRPTAQCSHEPDSAQQRQPLVSVHWRHLRASVASDALGNWRRRGASVRPNRRMKLTSLSAAPGWLQSTWAEVPPRAPAGRMDGGTGSAYPRCSTDLAPSKGSG
jgi:hypothetical protein